TSSSVSPPHSKKRKTLDEHDKDEDENEGEDEDDEYVEKDNGDDEYVEEDNEDDEGIDESNKDDREQESHNKGLNISNKWNILYARCWKLEGDNTCIACRFQLYQKDCVQALKDNELRITDIADAMAIIGVFAPFLPTQRMRAIFNKKILSHLVVSPPLPDPGIDDAAVLRAVRLYLNNKPDDASKELLTIDRKMRIMFEYLDNIARQERGVYSGWYTGVYRHMITI
ncbi:hypothetical protein BGZ76_005108, partial [Entomortierella beljakovae]